LEAFSKSELIGIARALKEVAERKVEKSEVQSVTIIPYKTLKKEKDYDPKEEGKLHHTIFAIFLICEQRRMKNNPWSTKIRSSSLKMLIGISVALVGRKSQFYCVPSFFLKVPTEKQLKNCS
jgi:hypothetical protein